MRKLALIALTQKNFMISQIALGMMTSSLMGYALGMGLNPATACLMPNLP
jgi:hypothetical protein